MTICKSIGRHNSTVDNNDYQKKKIETKLPKKKYTREDIEDIIRNSCRKEPISYIETILISIECIILSNKNNSK